MEPVKFTVEQSSLISSIQYDEAEWVLDVKFHNGNGYSYQNVGPEVYAELLDAESKGSYYNRNIKGHFESLNHRDMPPEMEPKTIEGTFQEQLKESVEERDPSWPPEDVMDAVMGNDALEVPGGTLGVAGGPDVKVVAPEPVALMVIGPVNEVMAKLSDVSQQLAVLNKKSSGLIVREFLVKDQATYDEVQQAVKDIKTHGGEIVKLVDPVRDVFYRAYVAVQERQKAATEPLNEAIRKANASLNAYDDLMAARRREQQRLADEEAARRSEELRKAESERLTLAAVDDHLQAGDTQAAERLFEEPIQAPSQPVYADRIYSEAPPPKGVSKRPNWKGEVTDIVEIILDVAKGIEYSRANPGKSAGNAPVSFLEADQSAINTTIKGTEGNVHYPGIRNYNDTVRSTRVGKK